MKIASFTLFLVLCLCAAPALAQGASAEKAKARCIRLGDILVADSHQYRESDLDLARRRLRRARNACDAALKVAPDDPRIMQYAGALRLADQDSEGASLLRKAAETGDPEAMRGYATAILTRDIPGKGVADAMELMHRAARAGHRQAQAELGMILARGDYGVPRDTRRALGLLRQYGRQGNAQAYLALGMIFLTTDPVVAEDPDGLADRELARRYLRKASRAGLPAAQAFFGQLLLKNAKNDSERERARDLIVAAANAGDQSGAYFLGTLYDMGYTVPKDRTKARRWYCRGGLNGIALAVESFGEDACKGIE